MLKIRLFARKSQLLTLNQAVEASYPLVDLHLDLGKLDIGRNWEDVTLSSHAVAHRLRRVEAD